MNTFHLSAAGIAIGGAGVLTASTFSLPSTVANVAKMVGGAEKNQAIVMNYMDNQNSSSYVRHNQTNMDNAWNYFNPSNYQEADDTPSTPDSTTTSPGVNPSGPMSTGTSANPSATAGMLPQVPPSLRHIIIGDATHALHIIKVHWRSSNSNSSWTPSGADWQADWSNWNPILWEQNGSTYANWAQRLGAYLSARFPGYAPQIKEIGL